MPNRLILLPGLDGTGLLFELFIRRLPPTIEPRVVNYPCDVAASYEETLPRVLEALPRDQPFALLGESYSGPLALMAAAARPPGLGAVVLCATFTRCPQRWLSSWLVRFAGSRLFSVFPEAIKLRALLGGDSTPELRSATRKALAALAPSVLAARLRSIVTVNVEPELRACPVPLLYLRGEWDRVVPKRTLRRMLQIVPSMEVVDLPAPHFVLQTRPEMAGAHVTRFIERLVSRPAS